MKQNLKGKRGLRQGDPLSPYLFVIAINCLSAMLNKAAENGKFNYHFNCRKSKLTHLSFADDLLIFVEGSLKSVQNVLMVLREFELRSGLAVSLQKSSFFASGLSSSELDRIRFSTGMQEGSLPVRYLGVPLCTKKLSISDCGPLIQQVKERISSWSSRALSFAGRLQLLKTVISGIANFWCSTFTIPKMVIKKLNTLCSTFLWKGKADGHNSARVAWDTITKKKRAGGLGIKDLIYWNKACTIKLIWMLFFRGGSIWVAWFKNEVLNGCLNNFWSIKPNARFSWLDNKLLKMRAEVFTWIRLRVGNGLNCRFWSDNWSDFGALDSFLPLRGGSLLGITKSAMLASLFQDGQWRIPPARSDNQLLFQIYLTTVHLNELDDYYEWQPNGNLSLTYSTGQIYDILRGPEDDLPWTSIVWYKGGIPKQCFLVWLMELNRSPTRDRLANWGLNTPTSCLLCATGQESRDHLFYLCPFSWSIWSPMARRCTYYPSCDWSTEVANLQMVSAPKHRKRLILLTWQTCIHVIWRERNSRLHRSIFSSADSLIAGIDLTIRNKIAGFRDTNPRLSSAMLQLWYEEHR